jgi:ATP-dependent RNA helicase RhlE
VLDEADRMLDMGFIHDIKKVITLLPRKDRQTLFFSATIIPTIMSLANSLLDNPEHISVTPVSSTVDTISQSLYTVAKEHKKDLLLYLLQDPNIKNAVIFTKTKH